jgi:nicotinic acid mononucleotide adenylyltransferase
MASPEEDELASVWERQLADEVAFARRRLKPTRPVCITFGRFNPPTTGHERLFRFLQAEAARRNAPALVFTSQTQDANNPLPYIAKVQWLRTLFPGLTVCQTPYWRTPMDVLAALSLQGFDAVYFIVGSDQVKEFDRLGKYVRSKGIKDGRFIILKEFGVIPVPEQRQAAALNVSGMSATKLREAVRAGDYPAFRRGVPTKIEGTARRLYYSLRKHMALTEGTAFLLYGTTLTGARTFRTVFDVGMPRVKVFNEAAHRLMEANKPFYVDVSGHSYSAVRSLMRTLSEAHYRTTIYLQEAPLPRQINEAWMKQHATYGLLRQLKRTVIVEDAVTAAAHAMRLLREAESSTPAPKQPTEVDRLRERQKQEVLSTKQRQSNDLLQAQQRELQKKNRESQQKIAAGAKSSA